MMKSITMIAAAAAALFLAGCMPGNSTASIPAVKNFQMDRYLGRWYEIARLPHTYEKGMTKVYAEYSLQENGRLSVLNTGTRDGKIKTIRGTARMKGAPDSGELEVSFFRPFWGEYKIFYLNDDYTIAMVTSSTDAYFWLLARTPELPQGKLDSLLENARQYGFATEKLIFPQQ